MRERLVVSDSAPSPVARLLAELPPALTPAEALHLISRVAVWIHRSRNTSRDVVARLYRSVEQNRLESAFQELTRGEDDLQMQHLFHGGIPIHYENVDRRFLDSVVRMVLNADSMARLADDLVDQWHNIRGFDLALDADLAQWIVSIAGVESGHRVLCLGDSAQPLAVAALGRQAQPLLVSAAEPLLAITCALLQDASIDFRIDTLNGPIREEWLSERDAVLVFPQLGRVEPHPEKQYRVRSSFGVQTDEAHWVEQLLRRTAGTAVVLVSMRFLSAKGAEGRLRTALIDSGRLESVIAFPAGLLNRSYVPFAVLVLGKARAPDVATTTFCELDETRYIANEPGKIRSGARCLINQAEFLTALQEANTPHCRKVSRQEIFRCDGVLTVRRYLGAGAEAHTVLRGVHRDRRVIALGDLFEVIKPQTLQSAQASSQSAESARVREVSPSELPEYGYLSGAARERLVSAQLLDRYQKQVIRPGDVVLSVKGVIGRTAIAAEIDGDVPIVPSQSSVILRESNRLRIDRESRLDPIVLLMYLRSPVFQMQLSAVVTGTTIPNVALPDLRGLRIIVPTKQEQAKLRTAFEKQCLLQSRIDELRRRQEAAALDAWAALDPAERRSDT